ncbi:hypothetical protein Pth03_57200 [Planotetraspora thailandica]|uniref:Uncharacterized protein n=1 Tax=Planotetraspora thailandica TaxID=487172 RepID=A0A8J3V9D5_9ACTN|nr:hypothetical protein Pth03_57200 [Planotetraspora thailandica]
MRGFDIICMDSGGPDCPPDHTTIRGHVERLHLATAQTYVVDPGEYEPFSVLWNDRLSMACVGGPLDPPYVVMISVFGDQAAIPVRHSIQPCEDKLAITPIGITA